MACLASIRKGKLKFVEFDSSADLLNHVWLKKNLQNLYPPVCQAIYKGDEYYGEALYDHAVGEYVKATAIGRFYFLGDSASSSAEDRPANPSKAKDSEGSSRSQRKLGKDSSHHRRRKRDATLEKKSDDANKSEAAKHAIAFEKPITDSAQTKSDKEQNSTINIITSKSTIQRKAKEWQKIIPASLKAAKKRQQLQQQQQRQYVEKKSTNNSTQLEGMSLQSQKSLSELKQAYSVRTNQVDPDEPALSKTELIRRSSGSTRSGSRRSEVTASRTIPTNIHKLSATRKTTRFNSLNTSKEDETKSISEPRLISTRNKPPPPPTRRRPKSTPTRLGTRGSKQPDPYSLMSSSSLSIGEEESEEGELEEFLNKIMQDENIRAATQDLLQTPVGKKAIRSVKNRAIGFISTFRNPPLATVQEPHDIGSLEKKLGKKLSSEKMTQKFSSSATTTSEHSLESFLRQTSKVVTVLEDKEPSLIELLSHVQSINGVLQQQTLLAKNILNDGGGSSEIDGWSDDEFDAISVASYTTAGISNHIEALFDSCDKIIAKALTRIEAQKGSKKRALSEYKKTFALEKAFIDQLRRGFVDRGKHDKTSKKPIPSGSHVLEADSELEEILSVSSSVHERGKRSLGQKRSQGSVLEEDLNVSDPAMQAPIFEETSSSNAYD